MSKYLRAFFCALIVISLSNPALATCYTKAEFEAEQAIRIHSELMVIGLTCQRMPSGTKYFSMYQSFSKKNRSLLSSYESRLVSYYKRTGESNPKRSLDSLRTGLANEVSLHATTMRVDKFCNQFGGRLKRALSMNEDEVRAWAATVWPNHPTSRPRCKSL